MVPASGGEHSTFLIKTPIFQGVASSLIEAQIVTVLPFSAVFGVYFKPPDA